MHKKEVRVVTVEHRRFAVDDAVRIGHNQALHRLAEHLCELDSRQKPGLNEILQNVACAHGRELIAIAYHNQAAAERKCIQQAGKEVDIHHGELVHNHGVRLERVARVTRENGAVVFRPFHLQ